MTPDPDRIQADLVALLREQVREFDLEPGDIGPQTLLVQELGFNSIDIMHLLASVDMHYERHLPYDELILAEGRYVSDIRVSDLVDFIRRNYDRQAPGPIVL